MGGLDPTDVNPPSFRLSKWRPGQDLERTIYLPVIRSGAQPGPGQLRNVFDFPQPSEFTGRRATTAVPTQALFLMNNPWVMEQAEHAAVRLLALEELDDPQRIQQAMLLTLGRPASAEELRVTLEFIESGEKDPQSRKLIWSQVVQALFSTLDFRYNH